MTTIRIKTLIPRESEPPESAFVAVQPPRSGRAARLGVERLESRWLLSGNSAIGPASMPLPAPGWARGGAPSADFALDRRPSGSAAYSPEELAEAEELPFRESFATSGLVGPTKTSLLFRLPMGPETSAMRISLRQPMPGLDLQTRLELIDEDGSSRSILEPTEGTSEIWILWSPKAGEQARPDGSLFLMVSLSQNGLTSPFHPIGNGQGNGGLAQPIDNQANIQPSAGQFILEIQRKFGVDHGSEGNSSPAGLGTQSLSTPTPDPSTTPKVPTASGPSAENDAPATRVEGAVVAQGLPTGPLPLMAAGPFGGILSKSSPIPVADSRDAVASLPVLVEPTSWVPRSRRRRPERNEANAEDQDPGNPPSDPALVAVRASGVLPLFGTSTRWASDRRDSPSPTLASLAGHAVPAERPPLPTPAAEESIAQETPRNERTRSLGRVSITSAALVALLATLSPHLPSMVNPIRAKAKGRPCRRLRQIS